MFFFTFDLHSLSECKQGTFGSSCLQTCPVHCSEDGCDMVTGYCLTCQPGYQRRSCDQICNPTWYGGGCRERCSQLCRDQLCHHENGKCDKCYSGAMGDFCQQVCPPNTYGEDCTFRCSPDCKSNLSAPLDICHPVTGVCSYKETQVKNDKVLGEKGIWVGITCTVVIGCIIVGLVCLFQKRRMNLMPLTRRQHGRNNLVLSGLDEHNV
ncbi:hypothetical protein Btru_036279 [Bulinus truncatus]|nr:hypothetical protein Btru_036279 [Bulinus truncatus]